MSSPTPFAAPSARETEAGKESPSARDASGGLPSISLPKGGGAIRGIGENFSANPVTGTGSLSVPIFTTPSRSDFYPKLSLTYDSGAGNGVFGLGWSLSVPSITRKTDRGLPRYADADESDTFILSDSEDLVPGLVQNGSQWTQDRFPASLNSHTYWVQRYRPRVEGGFARIERWESAETRVSFWKTVTRDNITSLFGLSPASQIVNPHDSSQVFKWLLDRTYDGHGNVIAYEYKAENSDNVPRSVYEAGRAVGANRYLKRIRYGSGMAYYPNDSAPDPTPLPSAWCFEVVFDYGEHNLDVPTPLEDSVWALRADPFSSYRATFEVRTYRLCRRVLMFHQFEELGLAPRLVRSTDFTYAPGPVATYLTSIAQTGFIRNPGDQSYHVLDPATNALLSPLSLPPLELAYTTPQVDPTLHVVPAASVENMRDAVSGARYRWIDLESEGLPGILTEQAGNWFYKHNVSNLPRDESGQVVPDDSPTAGTIAAEFEPLSWVAPKPSLAALATGRQQFLDLAGDGRQCLVQYDEPVPGFYERRFDNDWQAFAPFRALSNVAWDDPNLRFIDLDGDGLPDILITEHDVLTWYPSLGKEGFGPANRVPKPIDEDEGPALAFADSTQSIYLADFSGDGLSDIVRIRNGEVCYWPNLGYGRFGAKITMDQAPVFDTPDQFEQGRIRLADTDGSGTTDIVYLGRHKTTLWFNQSGNSWSDPQELPEFSATDNADSVSVLDLLGNGTACIVWSSPLPGDSDQPMRYIDLMGGEKPHLLISVRNNLGAEMRVQYAASTKFYLEDRAAGQPWITKLPFPVHVVETVETFDHVSATKLVTRYRYHHGHYDGVEREFRGFGMVEQFDTTSFSKYSGIGLFTATPDTAGEVFHLPPVYTKTWYHTGAFFGLGRIARDLESEYFQGDAAAVQLPGTPLPEGLTGTEAREACRALRGRMLRQEAYAQDGSPQAGTPYAVAESAFQLRLIQPRLDQRHASLYAFDSESLAYHYERNPSDPRISHHMTLEVDPYGNVTKSAAIGYPRRQSAGGPSIAPEQLKLLITYTENDVANVPDQVTWHRLGLPVETRTFELTGIAPSNSDGVFRLDEVQTAARAAAPISYETPPNGTIQRRLIGRTRTLYRKDDLSGPASLGVVESLGLPYETYKMVFTPGLLDKVFSVKTSTAALMDPLAGEGGYVNLDNDGVWWIPSGRLFLSPDPAAPDPVFARNTFFLPQGFQDPFGNRSTVQYEGHLLAVQQAQDALANTFLAQTQYRVMRPWLVTDPNQNRSGVRFDALGMVVALAVMGKAGQNEGDVLDLTTVEASTADDPTNRMEYDLFNWTQHGRPNFVHTFARELHGAGNPRWQESYSYSDGLAREVLKKIQAEPGLAPARDASGALEHDASGNLLFAPTTTRWVGSGRTVLDNKGNPVKKYEPFFDCTPAYEDEKELVDWGVTPILRYDPLSRLIRTDFADGTLSRLEFDPWRALTWDQNDTVLESRWHVLRQGLPNTDPRRKADSATLPHANTPSVAQFDTLGRTFSTTADNGTFGKYETRIELDIQGNHLSVTDALDRRIMNYDYDMLGRRLHQSSADAGERWTLPEVAGRPIREWNSRGFAVRRLYDALRRPTQVFWKLESAAEVLAECSVYGEAVKVPEAQNLRTRVYRVYDEAGVATNLAFDFKGNLMSSARQLSTQYEQTLNQQPPDWSPLQFLTDPAQIVSAAEPLLQSETFAMSATFDALNRPVTLTTPDGSIAHPTFNDANLLEALSVNLRGASNPTPFVSNIDYNARGQRERIQYASGVAPQLAETVHTYDPENFRLIELATTRNAGADLLQDLTYTYDPVGNVTFIDDAAQETIYFNNQAAPAQGNYTYDPIYRLLTATGRELIGLVNQPQTTYDDGPRMRQPLPSDGRATQNYTENYSYDPVGNITQVVHQVRQLGTVPNGSWTRSYAYDEPNPRPTNNRLTSTTVGTVTDSYQYDAHGNITHMPHLSVMVWDFKDQLQSTPLQVVNAGLGDTTGYVYDAAGQRVRKVTLSAGGTKTGERIYVGHYEVYREYGSVPLERQTLHVMDDKRRVAIVDTQTLGTTRAPQPVSRYQFDNLIGSACLELDDHAAVISYEEYYPYGSTSFQGGPSAAEVSLKRYRYTGKERDVENGFYYHGVRYYAPWLGRWVSCDPLGIADSSCLYSYSFDNPVRFTDPSGKEPESAPIVTRREEDLKMSLSGPSAVCGPCPSVTGPMQNIPAAQTGDTSLHQAATSAQKEEYSTWQLIKDTLRALPKALAQSHEERRQDVARAFEESGESHDQAQAHAEQYLRDWGQAGTMAGQLAAGPLMKGLGVLPKTPVASARPPAVRPPAEPPTSLVEPVVAGGKGPPVLEAPTRPVPTEGATVGPEGGGPSPRGPAPTPKRINSARELIRRAEEPGPYHNFPESFDEHIFARGVRRVISPDYVQYELRGSVNGVEGTFEIGVRPSASGRTEVITHRFFRRD